MRPQPQPNGVAKPPALTSARSLPQVCDQLRRKVMAFLEEDLAGDKRLRGVQEQVRVSMGVIEEALRRYGPEQLSLSYNGGKDCLVLLVLLLACLPSIWPSRPSDTANSTTTGTTSTAGSSPKPITSETTTTSPSNPSQPTRAGVSPSFPQTVQAVYVVSPHPFPEVEDFVASTAREYNLDLSRYALPMKAALEAYLGERQAVRAVFVGTRRTDPHGEKLTHFDPTDDGWPPFMRVHPVIDWHYVEVWAFIRHLEIPFCDLYNRGFTSLGGMTDTHPNPALAIDGSKTKFRPAYELMADNEERLGRDR